MSVETTEVIRAGTLSHSGAQVAACPDGTGWLWSAVDYGMRLETQRECKIVHNRFEHGHVGLLHGLGIRNQSWASQATGGCGISL